MTSGFSKASFAFYTQLGAHNTREWWLEHKSEYESVVLEPLKALVAELEPEFGDAHIFRPNRDIRFTQDKSPYKLNASFYLESRHGVGGLYFELSEGGIFVGGGLYEPQPDQLDAWRNLFDTDKKELVKSYLDEARKSGLELSREQEVKTAPRGWDTSHPEIGFIRLKNAVIGKSFSVSEILADDDFFGTVTKTFAEIERWNQLLSRMVGPSKLEPRW